MEFYAIYAPSAESTGDEFVFTDKIDALKLFKTYKDSRLKSFNNRSDALKFAKIGLSCIAQDVKSPLSQKSLEKSNFPAPKSQDLVKFRKDIEANNIDKVYKTIWSNPRYLVSSGDTPSIMKEGPRYNALHIAAMNNLPKMAKLILQTLEQTSFIELLHGCKDSNAEELSQLLLESYLNTPDKSRNETPLHFAAKLGHLDVIEVLISYPLCKMKVNSEGLFPKDIICARNANANAIAVLISAIEELLKERFFVPVLRSNDNTVQPMIGNPFTPKNMPTNFNKDPLSPSMEIKAYAGPMDKEQAQTFQRRWKTPPRLIPNGVSNLNLSFSPKSSNFSSPMFSPRHSKSLSEIVSSTPKTKKKLFGTDDIDEEFDEVLIQNITGSSDDNGIFEPVNEIFSLNEEEDFKELYDDLMQDKKKEKLEKLFQGYRNPISEMAKPKAKNDTNSNYINHNFNGGKQLFNNKDSLLSNIRSNNNGAQTYLDDSGSFYNSDSVYDSPSFKEKHIRLTNTEKGLELIGRGLAQEQGIEWKEFWDFLGRFVDIRSDDGLQCFENYLKQKEQILELNENTSEMNKSPEKSKINDSLGLGAICAGFYSMDINNEIADKTPKYLATSPSSAKSTMSLINDFMLNNQDFSDDNSQSKAVNPYLCIEKSCRIYANRLVNTLANQTIQDQHIYEKTLLSEIKKLSSIIDSYKRDQRFNDVNFQKIHSRYSYLFVWYLKQNNVEVKYLRTYTMLMSKVYVLASQYAKNFCDVNKDANKSHAVCLSNFVTTNIEKQAKIGNPDLIETEVDCVAAWNSLDIWECMCSFEMIPMPVNSLKNRQNHRREIRKKLYSESESKKGVGSKVDIWAARITQNSDDEDDQINDTYVSCSESSDDEYFTPPESPSELLLQSDDEMSVFEESLEHLEDQKIFRLFIDGEEPAKIDSDVLNALGDTFVVDVTKYPLVSDWLRAIKKLQSKSREISLPYKFRIYTPKLKKFNSFQ